jgi:phage protein D
MAEEKSLVPEVQIKIDGSEIAKDIANKLMKVKISSSVDGMDIAKVSFHEQEQSLQDESIFTMGKSITIGIGYKQKFEELFNGDIIRIDYKFQAQNVASLELVCFDKLFKMSRIKHQRAFLKMKDSAIAQQMASEAGLQTDVESTSETYDYIFQNNQSNLDFLRMRAKRIGYEVAACEGKLVFKKARFSKQDKSVELKWGENLIEFNAKIDSTEVLEEIIVTSWDPLTKKEVEGKAKAGDEAKVASPSTMGTSEVKSKIKDSAKNYKIDIPNLKASEAKNLAKAELTRRSMEYLSADGTTIGNPKIKAAKIITIKEVGKKLSGDYYITSCEHIYTKKGYKTIFEAKNNGINS